jgi:hypothetical protein
MNAWLSLHPSTRATSVIDTIPQHQLQRKEPKLHVTLPELKNIFIFWGQDVSATLLLNLERGLIITFSARAVANFRITRKFPQINYLLISELIQSEPEVPVHLP